MRAEPGPPFTHTAALSRHYLTGLRDHLAQNLPFSVCFCSFVISDFSQCFLCQSNMASNFRHLAVCEDGTGTFCC